MRKHLAVAVIVGFALLFGSSLALANLGPLGAHFIDVGQGDSILLRAPDGTDILIDGGPRIAGPTVVAYLNEQGVDDIEVMVLTHPDADHVGGLIDVLQSTLPVEAVVYGRPGTTATYNDFAAAMQADGLTPTPVAEGQAFTWGPMQVSVLNPQTPFLNDTNEDSVVLHIAYGDHEFLFTGDIGAEAEGDILTSGLDVDADVLKVAHHGSRYSSTQAFLNAVTPIYAVISVGEDNPFGHPAQETLDRLATVGAQVYRTDLCATVVITSDGQLFTVSYDEPQPSPGFLVFLPSVQRALGAPGTAEITNIFYDGLVPYVESDEYAVIENTGGSPLDVGGWRLNAGAPGQDFVFPSYTMQPGQECRVYTNEYHPEFCGFSFGSSSALWTNSGDCGYLYDATGTQVSSYCY